MVAHALLPRHEPRTTPNGQVIGCSCGWRVDWTARDWRPSGEQFDAHLAREAA